MNNGSTRGCSCVLFCRGFNQKGDQVQFEALDRAWDNYLATPLYNIDGVPAGEDVRIEVDWKSYCYSTGKNYVYEKNGSNSLAHTGMYSGLSYSHLGGCSSLWYA